MITPVVVGTLLTNRSAAKDCPIWEETPPSPQDQRVNHQQVLVDEIVGRQRLDQLAAAHDGDILFLMLLEAGHRLGHVAFEERGVAPWKRFLQRL